MDPITFTYRNDTKNKFRFEEQSDDDDIIGTLYISKSAFDGAAPPELVVTIATVEAKAKTAKAGK